MDSKVTCVKREIKKCLYAILAIVCNSKLRATEL